MSDDPLPSLKAVAGFIRARAMARVLVGEDRATALSIALTTLAMIARHQLTPAQFEHFAGRIGDMLRDSPETSTIIFEAHDERQH
jgi:hypothetical protein